MRVIVNGDERDLRDGATVADLLADLGLTGTRVAVEVGARLVRRADHAGRVLHPGERVEIVTLVGGG